MADSPQVDGSGKRRAKRPLPRWARPIVAAVIGALLAALCKQLPPDYRAPCRLASHVLPSACNAPVNDKPTAEGSRR